MSFHVDPNIAEARTLDVDFYLSVKYYQHSKELIFAHSWQLAGDEDQVKEPGWVTPFSFLEHFIPEELLLTRDADHKLHCLSNVCTHRGNLVVERPCKLRDLRCKYHGRRFGLDRKFLTMPEFKEVKNFPSETDWPRYRCSSGGRGGLGARGRVAGAAHRGGERAAGA